MLYQQSFFEKTAKKYPEAIAVDDQGKQFTYDHLEKFSNKDRLGLYNSKTEKKILRFY